MADLIPLQQQTLALSIQNAAEDIIKHKHWIASNAKKDHKKIKIVMEWDLTGDVLKPYITVRYET